MLAVQRQRQPALDQVNRVGTEHLVPPALEDRDVALAGGQPVEVLGIGDQPARDAGLLGLEPQQGAQASPPRAQRTHTAAREIETETEAATVAVSE